MIATERIVEVSGKGKITAHITVPESLKIIDHKEKLPKNGRCFRIMTPKDGDKRITWNSDFLNEIEDAKEMFDECVAKGLVPYKVGLNGKASSEVMDVFDPDAQEVIFLPVEAIVGG